MRAAFRTALSPPVSRLLQPLLSPLHFRFSPLLQSSPSPSCSSFPRHFSTFPPPDPFLVPPPSPFPMEKQFEEFKLQLEESGGVREKIRGVVVEVEAANRMLSSCLLLVHQSLPLSGVLEKANGHIGKIKSLFAQLAVILKDCPSEFYRYHGEWRSETQTVVSMVALLHWLETGALLMHAEAEKKLGLESSDFSLDVEDYLTGLCFMSNEFPRYVVNRVTAGDYDCPRKVLSFLTDLHTAFRMLNLRNDFLRKKFDGMKYDLRRVEEVYYDVKIRGLASDDSAQGQANATPDQVTES
ncbi:Translin [Rhynchospora pubera]|uniref:Translin n=1 Tax=Rhynchospora pubera TaxID=906938 RepID=A0AAV8GH48_9POAL|nr:Translin [Rhynchospora pubera]